MPRGAHSLADAKLSIRIPRQDTTPCGRLMLGRQLQSGAHGTVRVATALHGGHRAVAVKVAHSDVDSIQRLVKEANILAALPAHLNVIPTYPTALPASQDPVSRAVYLPMQLCDTDLLELLLTERMDRATVLRYAQQLTSALAHCHEHGVYHLDVKPENVLVDMKRDQLKLADFGMALRLTPEQAVAVEGRYGSASYAAPEVWDAQAAGVTVPEGGASAAAADVWSLGALIFTMVFGRRCWTDVSLRDKDFRHYALTGDFLMYGSESTTIDKDTVAMLKRMLHLQPAKRPSLDEVAAWLAVESTKVAAEMEEDDDDLDRASTVSDCCSRAASVDACSPSSVSFGFRTPELPATPRGVVCTDDEDEPME